MVVMQHVLHWNQQFTSFGDLCWAKGTQLSQKWLALMICGHPTQTWMTSYQFIDPVILLHVTCFQRVLCCTSKACCFVTQKPMAVHGRWTRFVSMYTGKGVKWETSVGISVSCGKLSIVLQSLGHNSMAMHHRVFEFNMNPHKGSSNNQ